jgi:hypothetical protein
MNIKIIIVYWNWNSSVGVATGWTAGFRSPAGTRDFSVPSVQTDPGAHPAFCTVGTGGFFPGANFILMLFNDVILTEEVCIASHEMKE